MATAETVREYLATIDATERTKEDYETKLGYYLAWEESEKLAPSRETILRYKEHLRTTTHPVTVVIEGKKTTIQKTYEPSTANSYLLVASMFYEFLIECGKLAPVGKIKRFTETRDFKKDPLTIAQAQQLIHKNDGKLDEAALRDKAIISLMIGTGLRCVEVTRANVGDIRNKGNQTVLAVWGKGRDTKDQSVVLSPSVQAAINNYLMIRGTARDDDPLFASRDHKNIGGRMTTRSISRIVKENLKDLGINSKRITAHSLRHTSGTAAILGGASVVEAKELLRHASLETTTRYLHSLNEGKAEESIERLLNGTPEAIGQASPMITTGE